MSRQKIYVAGPYTKGDIPQNVANAITAGNELADLGFIPFVPHIVHWWHLQHPRPYGFWCDWDNEWLPHCDGLLRLPGLSNGSDAEIELAMRLDMPVFYEIGDVDRFFSPNRVVPRFDLIPRKGLHGAALAMGLGVPSHGENDWLTNPAITYSLNMGHVKDHIAAYMAGDRSEDHLAHAAARLMMQVHMEAHLPERNDLFGGELPIPTVIDSKKYGSE